MKIRVVGAEFFHADRQTTDIPKLIVALRNPGTCLTMTRPNIYATCLSSFVSTQLLVPRHRTLLKFLMKLVIKICSIGFFAAAFK
jgi:hypothetical protein